MVLDSIGRAFIQREEGCVLHTYQCSAGVNTIGWGHTAGVEKGMTISLAQAQAYFNQDIKSFEAGVSKLLGDTTVSQNQFNALVSFAFNLGVGALGKSTLLKKVKTGTDDKAIAAAFKMWCNVNGKPNAAIRQRREREAVMFAEK